MAVSWMASTGSATQADALTRFYPPSSSLTLATVTEASSQFDVNDGGTIDKLIVNVSANDIASATSATITLRDGGANTSLTVSYGTSQTGIKEDTTHSVSVTTSSLIAYAVVATSVSGSHNITLTAIGAQFTPTTTGNCISHLVCGNTAGITLSAASTTTFVPVNQDSGAAGTSTEANVKWRSRGAFTMTHFQSAVASNARTTTTTLNTRKNGGNGNGTVNYTSTQTGAKLDSSNSDSIVAGDDFNYSITTGTGTGNIVFTVVGCRCLSTSAEFNGISAGPPLAQSFNTTRFFGFSHDMAAADATEANVNIYPQSAFTAKELTAVVTANTIATSATLIRVRNNAANGNQSLSYAAAETGIKSDSVNTDAIAAGSTGKFAYSVVTPNTSGSISIAYISVIGGTNTTTTQTQTGKARITATGTQTQLGTSRITATGTQTQLGKSRVRITSTQTQPGKARVTASTPQTQLGRARTTATTTQTETGKARIRTTASQTLPGQSRIAVTVPQTIPGKSRITATAAQTQAGKAAVQNTGTQTQLGKARIQTTSGPTITGLSRLTAGTVQTQPGKSRVQATSPQTQPGKGRIQAVDNQTQTGLSSIRNTTEQVQLGQASISNNNVTARTITGKSAIRNTTTQTQAGKSRLTGAVSQNQIGLSRIRSTGSSTIAGHSRLTVTSSNTQQGLSRIQVGASGTQPAKSRITGTTPQLQIGKAAIRNTTEKTITGLAKITQFALRDETITGVSSIALTSLQMQTGVARIISPPMHPSASASSSDLGATATQSKAATLAVLLGAFAEASESQPSATARNMTPSGRVN